MIYKLMIKDNLDKCSVCNNNVRENSDSDPYTYDGKLLCRECYFNLYGELIEGISFASGVKI